MLDEDFYSCHARFPLSPPIGGPSRSSSMTRCISRATRGMAGAWSLSIAVQWGIRMVSDRYNAYAVIILLEHANLVAR